jgi:hypothetical protein
MQRLTWITLGLSIFLSPAAKADQELRIIESRRSIPLTDQEPKYTDYYINAGTANGLKKDLVVKVVRRIPIRNAQGTEEFGSIETPVGEVRIIYADVRTSVAREYKIFDREELPVLENQAIMIGDIIDLSGAFEYKKQAIVSK